MAAEYEVNIKLNSKDIETQLDGIGKKISKLGKSKGGGQKSPLALPSTEMLVKKYKAVGKELKNLDGINRKIILSQSQINKQSRDQALNINTLTKIQDKKAKLVNKVNELEAKGLNVQKFRNQIGKISDQQSARRFASAEKEVRLLGKMLQLEQSKARILRSESQNFPSSPVRGTRAMMGSPAQIAASGRQRVSPIGGRLDIAGSPAQINAISRLERAEIRAAKNVHMAKLPLVQKRQKIRLNNIDKLFKEDVKKLAAFDKKLAASDAARAKRHAGSQIKGLAPGQTAGPSPRAFGPFAASPVGGTMGTPGSPAFKKGLELGKFRSTPIRGGANIAGSPLARLGGMKRLEQIGLGAGFPLLFGGGAGSILGGAAGGAAGSFGAQIAFSAVGQQVDQFLGKTIESAQSLTSVGKALDFLRERSLFSSKESEELARKLESQGDLTGIAALVTEELNIALGPDGIQKMQDLAEQTKLAKEQWGLLTTNLEALISGPLAEFLKIVNATLGIKVAQSQFARALTTLQEKDPERLRKMLPSFEGSKSENRVAQIASTLAFGPNAVGGVFDMQGVPETALISFTEQMNSILKGMGVSSAEIPITSQDRDRFKNLKADRAAEKARREEERLQKRLAKLDQERLKVIEISKFKEKIALAEAAGDTLGVVRIQNEQRLEEIEQNKLKSLISATTEKEKQAITDLAAAKTEAAKLENARLLAEEEASIARLREDSLRPLEEQRELLQAKLEGNEKEVRIKQQIAGILRSNDNLNKQEVADLVNKNNLLEEQVAQVVRLESLYQSIGSAIESGLVNGIMGAIDGTKTLQESLAGVLRDIGSIMLQFGIRTGLNAINPTMFPLQMAEGGYVSSPTSAIIGEGGEPEYVIPESKMRTAMSRYSRGSRGESVISGSGDSEIVGKVGGTAVAPSIDVRFTVERINSVDYVTAGEFQAGMQQAATQGAKQGEQATLKRLQMSGSTRRRIGI